MQQFPIIQSISTSTHLQVSQPHQPPSFPTSYRPQSPSHFPPPAHPPSSSSPETHASAPSSTSPTPAPHARSSAQTTPRADHSQPSCRSESPADYPSGPP